MIKIKKRVNLAFLGEDYKDSYIEVYSITIDQLKKLIEKITLMQEQEKTGEALDFMVERVQEQFAGGSIWQDGKMTEVRQEDLGSLPSDVYIEAFQELTGKIQGNS
jgi:uncharacterized protein (UPF0305 family)